MNNDNAHQIGISVAAGCVVGNDLHMLDSLQCSKDRDALAGTQVPQLARDADLGQTGARDQDIDALPD